MSSNFLLVPLRWTSPTESIPTWDTAPSAAVVNGKMVPLNTGLMPGDVIEIRKARAPRGPSLDWQDTEKGYLVTNSGRAKVRQWFSRQARRHQSPTRPTTTQTSHRPTQSHGNTPSDTDEIADLMGYPSTEELITDLGKTRQQPSIIVRTVVKAIDDSRPENVIAEQLAAGEREAQQKRRYRSHKGRRRHGNPRHSSQLPTLLQPRIWRRNRRIPHARKRSIRTSR